MDRVDAIELLRGHGCDTPVFSPMGTSMWARVVDVYDGDTITVVAQFMGRICRLRTRLFGLDASELKSKDPENARRGQRARDRLLQLIMGSDSPITENHPTVRQLLSADTFLVWVECMTLDRFGRVVAVVRDRPDSVQSFGDVLLSEKLAYPYTGKKRLSPEEQNALLSGPCNSTA